MSDPDDGPDHGASDDATAEGSTSPPVGEDAELLARARAGDAGASDALARRHVAAVAALVTRLVGDQDRADDLVQDTFMIAFTKLHQVRDADAFRGWLYRIAVRKVTRSLRRQRVLRSFGLLAAPVALDLERVASTDATAEQRAELAALGRALGRQAPRPRVAWCLRHVEGHTLEETAELSNCSLATVKRWIRSVDRAVRAELGVGREEPHA